MSGLDSLFDDFDLSAPSSKKGASMNSMKQGGFSSEQTSRASASAGASSGGGTRDAFEDLFGLGATTTPTRAIPTGNVPSATPGAPPASDFFASPRMGAAPGATTARPSADPFGGLGAGDSLFGSLGGGAPGGGTPMAAMGRSSARPPPAMASPASDDLLGAILGDGGGSAPGSGPGSGLGSRLGSESDFSAAGGSTRVEPAGTSTLASSLGGSASDFGVGSGGGLGSLSGLEAFASRGGSSSDLASVGASAPSDGFAGLEDLVSSAPAPSAIRRRAAETATGESDGGFGGLEDLVASAQPSQTVSRTASANDFDIFAGDGAGASPSVSSPDASGTAADGGFAGLEDFLSPRPAPSGSQRHAAPAAPESTSDAGLEAMLGELSVGGNGGGFGGGGSPVVIDDMFGPAMGSGFNAGVGVAGEVASRVGATDVMYESSDDEGHEDDSEARKKARAARHERNRKRIADKLQEKRYREAKALAEQAERQVLKDLIGADIDEWLRKNQNNIRTMLANLADVLWEGHGYKSPDLNDLLSPNAVKKSYHKALVIIHPDKVRQKFGGDMDKVFVADKVFDQVRDAYKAFSEKEL